MTLDRIAVVTGDHALPDDTKWDGAFTEDDLRLHETMVEALRSIGRWKVDVHNEHAGLVDRLRADPPQLVLNFCDTGFGNVATQELHVPALLEILGIPYTGATPAGMVLAYDKSVVNMLARTLGIPVPDERIVGPDDSLDDVDVAFPAFVKPAMGDGSVGINRGALVQDAAQLRRQLEWFREELPGRVALVQEYLPGRELGLALIGNPGAFEALPPLEVDYSALPSDLPPILAFESKTGPETAYERIGIQAASLCAETLRSLEQRAAALFERIGCRDYARFDFRAAADGTIKLMEVNPNPAWSCEAKLAKMARFKGWEYPQLLERLVDIAWARVA